MQFLLFRGLAGFKMKKFLLIVSLAICFLALSFVVYFIGVKVCFSSDKLIKRTQRAIKTAFQRDAEISKIKLSPWGEISVSAFSIAQKGGFETGTTLSVKSVESKILLAKLLKRELVLKPFEISEAVLKLNYLGSRKFNYKSSFEKAKYILSGASAKHGLVKSAEIQELSLVDSSVELKLDFGEMTFSNITLKIAQLDFSDTISGSGSFDFSFKKIKTNASFNFKYKARDSLIEIQNLICIDFNISADAKIKLNADGSVLPEYIARVNKQKLLNVLKDFPLYANIIQLSYPEAIDEIILIYPR
jgi:uncharacterized protein involved in outer membrane biogenesis